MTVKAQRIADLPVVRSAPYTINVEQKAALLDRLAGTRYWISLWHEGRYVTGEHASSLAGVRRVARRWSWTTWPAGRSRRCGSPVTWR